MHDDGRSQKCPQPNQKPFPQDASARCHVKVQETESSPTTGRNDQNDGTDKIERRDRRSANLPLDMPRVDHSIGRRIAPSAPSFEQVTDRLSYAPTLSASTRQDNERFFLQSLPVWQFWHLLIQSETQSFGRCPLSHLPGGVRAATVSYFARVRYPCAMGKFATPIRCLVCRAYPAAREAWGPSIECIWTTERWTSESGGARRRPTDRPLPLLPDRC
jgi:hypothetical protein